jgi:hypothetical protein
MITTDIGLPIQAQANEKREWKSLHPTRLSNGNVLDAI